MLSLGGKIRLALSLFIYHPLDIPNSVCKLYALLGLKQLITLFILTGFNKAKSTTEHCEGHHEKSQT